MDINGLKKLSVNLQKSFLTLSSEEECFRFLRDLMTEAEIIDFSQRLDIAIRLQKGEPYKQIESSSGVSSTTIARVGKFLNGEH
ncbi:MAG: TrpR-like protein YerC/YecD [Candidatus Peribacteria bacterium]|jgi:TrpR-related protein YerC/YecD|nr:TrpR-like protein YerC/YecD [Candidatus Peribacteria bacterium]